MLYALVIAFLLVLAVCALLNLVTLPGNWIMAALVGLWYFFAPDSVSGDRMGLTFFLMFFGLAVFGEVVEFVSQIWGGKKYGSSNKSTIFGMIGAIIGAILLAPVLFGLGAVVGALAGAWVGSFASERLLERKPFQEAVTAANGALIGRFLGMAVKLGLGIAMVVLTFYYTWPL